MREKQKKVRALEVKVRDLLESREQWKNRALAAEAKLKEQNVGAEVRKKKEIEIEITNLDENLEQSELNIKGHSYSVEIIQKSLALLIGCGISFRGIEKVFELFKSSSYQKTPSFTCIRKWLGRMGIYLTFPVKSKSASCQPSLLSCNFNQPRHSTWMPIGVWCRCSRNPPKRAIVSTAQLTVNALGSLGDLAFKILS